MNATTNVRLVLLFSLCLGLVILAEKLAAGRDLQLVGSSGCDPALVHWSVRKDN